MGLLETKSSAAGKRQVGEDGKPKGKNHNTRPLEFWSNIMPATAQNDWDGLFSVTLAGP